MQPHNLKRQLNKDIRKIKRSKKVLVFTNKISNIHKLETDECKKLTTEVVTSTYKKVSDKINNKIIQKAKDFGEQNLIKQNSY